MKHLDTIRSSRPEAKTNETKPVGGIRLNKTPELVNSHTAARSRIAHASDRYPRTGIQLIQMLSAGHRTPFAGLDMYSADLVPHPIAAGWDLVDLYLGISSVCLSARDAATSRTFPATK